MVVNSETINYTTSPSDSDSISYSTSPSDTDSADYITLNPDSEVAGYGNSVYGGSRYGDNTLYGLLNETILSGQLTGQASLTGALRTGAFTVLTGSIESQSSLAGDLTAFDERVLSAALNGESVFSGSLRTDIGTILQGTVSSNGVLTGGLNTFDERVLSASMDSNAEFSGTLIDFNLTSLQGNLEGDTTITAELTAFDSRGLTGTANSSATLTGNIVKDLTISGSLNAESEVSGILRQELAEELRFNEFTPEKLASTGRKNARALANQIGDPVNRPSGQMVYDSMPRVKSQGFNGYPFIVVEEYTFNDIGDTVNGLNTEYDFDVELHIYGLEESEEDLMAMDEILDELNYLVKGPNSVRLGAEARLARPQFIRQNRLTGINEKDQPIVRYEVEIRGKLHLNMDG